jgi:hypothetical protein
MKRCWDEPELIDHWTLFESEKELFVNRTDTGKLATAVLTKFFQFTGRFPRYQRDVPGPVLAFVAEQLSVLPTAWFDYDLKGRSSKRDRERIRAFLGFRPITLEDEEQLRWWLELEIVPEDMDSRHLRLALAIGVAITVWNRRRTSAPIGCSPRRFTDLRRGSSMRSTRGWRNPRAGGWTPWWRQMTRPSMTRIRHRSAPR